VGRRLGATQRFWVALVASALLHVFLFVVLENRAPVFSAGSEYSSGAHGQAVILTFSQRVSNADDKTRRLIDPQTLLPPGNDSFNVSETAQISESVDRRAGGQYKAIGLLTKLPQPIGEIDLNSPEIAEQARQARITLLLSVNSSGFVDDVKVTSSDGVSANEQWVARIVTRFRQSRFVPGEIDGQPVSTEFPVKVVVE
jgi:hypothetical protein